MVSMVDVLSKQPWGQTYSQWHTGFTYGWKKQTRTRNYDFRAEFTLIPDKKGNCWLRGDMIIFGSGFFDWQFQRKWPWKKWFMQKPEYLKSLEASEHCYHNKIIPRYARLEYGLVLSRYKWSKYKPSNLYRDYGSIIIMLTGSKAGHIRRYYLKTPYELVSRYPYDHITPLYKTREGLTEIPELRRIQEAMNYAKSKEQYIINMVASFHDENYPMNMENAHDIRTHFRIIRKRT